MMDTIFAEHLQQTFKAMVRYYAGDPARIQHFTKVHAYARFIGLEEGLSEREQYILELTALVHDIGIKPAEAKYGSCMGKYQEQEGPEQVRRLFAGTDVDEKAVERICFLVGHHHTYSQIDGLDYQILVEADFLVNIFEDGLPEKSALSVRDKIFKTRAGIELLNQMYALS